MSLSSSIKGSVLGSAIKKVADSESRTTLLGFAAAAILADKIDYGKLFEGDPQQIGNLVGVIVVAVFGYFTNHPKVTPDAKP